MTIVTTKTWISTKSILSLLDKKMSSNNKTRNEIVRNKLIKELKSEIMNMEYDTQEAGRKI